MWNICISVCSVAMHAWAQKKKVKIRKLDMSVFPSARWISKISEMTLIKLCIFIYNQFFHQQIALKFKKETVEVLHVEYSFVWCWNLDT